MGERRDAAGAVPGPQVQARSHAPRGPRGSAGVCFFKGGVAELNGLRFTQSLPARVPCATGREGSVRVYAVSRPDYPLFSEPSREAEARRFKEGVSNRAV